ncbi:M28 family metallopeptidase [uncultured Clostridium sp.]|uniref:M28 family metallopeptidase n=1 Tax=uncultured Clostridium sp. TaxID=59620 RepID=UPI0025F17542|nr:M28 family metallopeptidase [uncultured Clostridium sp.]
MKKYIYYSAICISLLCLTFSLILKGSFNEFNTSYVKHNIEYLSSDEFKGRLAGSSENLRVVNEISELFKEYSLKPLDKDFKESFKAAIPVKNNKTSSLKILNNSCIIKDFSLGKDFKDDLLNFKKSSIEFTNKDTVCIYSNSFSLFKDGIEYLFYVNLDNSFSFRSSFCGNSNYGFVIQITTATFNEILDSLRNGYTLKVELPYDVKETELYNVVGKINGLSKKLPPLILTAHFDHLGSDSLDTVYKGALDNASGISFLLELMRNFSSLKFPIRDIIFVALNGEEMGLIGSDAFASKYKDILSGAEVINFDMIGADNIPVTFILGKDSKNSYSSLLNNLENICNSKNIKYLENYANSSDHASFINNNFDSLTISHSDTTNIHTPNDTADKISAPAIYNVYELISDEIKNYAYNDIFLLFYNSKIILFFTISSFLLVSFRIIKIKKF